MPCVLRTNDKAIDAGIGQQGRQIRHERRARHLRVTAPTIGHVIPNPAGLAAIRGLEDIFDEALGVDVGGGDKADFHGAGGSDYQLRRYAKISGATMEASDSMMYFGVSLPSLPQVIFSFGTAPE